MGMGPSTGKPPSRDARCHYRNFAWFVGRLPDVTLRSTGAWFKGWRRIISSRRACVRTTWSGLAGDVAARVRRVSRHYGGYSHSAGFGGDLDRYALLARTNSGLTPATYRR